MLGKCFALKKEKKKKAISRLSLQMLRDVCLKKKKKKSPLYYKLQIYSYLYLQNNSFNI